MPKPFDDKAPADDWDEHRKQVIGLGQNSFRKSYYPELRRNITNVKNLVLAIDQSPRGIFICVRDGRVEYVNSTLLKTAGCCADDLIGKKPRALWQNAIQGENFDFVMQQMEAGRTWRGDLLLRNNEGGEIWVQMFIQPVLDDTGDLTHFLGSMEDISMRKRIEEELKAVALAREQALEAAHHLSALKSQIMANMSHELRTPLNGVLGLAEIGNRNFQNAEKARDLFAKIKVSGERLLGVVQDVLDFSDIESGKLLIRHTDVYLSELIEHVAETIRDRTVAKRLDFRVELAPELPAVCTGDPLRIRQVLLYLLSNAVKFTEAGSVTLSVALKEDKLIFRVTDTGIGISAEQLGKVFDPFQQADGSSTRKFGGTGLGLAISQQLLSLMGGEIRIDSQLTSGTVVEFFVPYLQK